MLQHGLWRQSVAAKDALCRQWLPRRSRHALRRFASTSPSHGTSPLADVGSFVEVERVFNLAEVSMFTALAGDDNSLHKPPRGGDDHAFGDGGVLVPGHLSRPAPEIPVLN